MPGTVHAKLQELATGSSGDRRFPHEEKRAPTTVEQPSVSREVLGIRVGFLQPGVRLPVETIGERAIGVVCRESADLRVDSTAQPMHQHERAPSRRRLWRTAWRSWCPCSSRKEK